jgi:hypothetical protein
MLGFLKNVQVIAPDKEPRKGGGGVRKERNPLNADIRIFADGSIYPSVELVKKFQLEYGNRPATKEEEPTGNGFDIIDSDEFKQYIPVPQRCIWISPVARKNAKVDLFGTTTFNEDGTPKSSVLEQGPVTFGKTSLLPLIEEAYGMKCDEETKFIDLTLCGTPDENGQEHPLLLPPGKTVAFIPKAKQRGDEKGTATVIRRDLPEFWCLYPTKLIEAAKEQAKIEQSSNAPLVTETV